MNRSKLKELLEGLPDTERDVLAVIQYLDQQGHPEKAHSLLLHAIEVGAGDLCHMELGHRLVDRKKPLKALATFERINNEKPLQGPLALLRAVAEFELGRPEQSRTQLGYAIDAGIPLYVVNSWESHLFHDEPRPEFPYSTIELADNLSQRQDPLSAAEETSVFSPDAVDGTGGDVDQSDITNPFERSERTDLISLDHKTVSQIGDETIERHLSDTTVFETTAPGVRGGEGGESEKVELAEAMEPELPQQSPTPTLRHEPANSPSPIATVIMEWASPHVDTARRSPLGLALAIGATALILLLGMIVSYSVQANSHVNAELQRVYSAIDSDRYTEYQSALKTLQTLSDSQPQPAVFSNRAIVGLAEFLPGLGVRDKLEPVESLTHFIKARMAYRFENPNPIDRTLPAHDSPVMAAAGAYRHLTVRDADAALELIEPFLGEDQDVLLTMAYGEALLATDDPSRVSQILEEFSSDSEAMASIHARLKLLVDEDDGIAHLESLVRDHYPDHPGLRLKLATYQQGPAEIIDELVEPEQFELSPVERGKVQLIRASKQNDTDGIRKSLEAAADAAPLHRDLVKPLIDFLLVRGEFHAARSQLLRIPDGLRDPYFDIALGRLYLLLGDLPGALAVLSPHSSLEARGMMAIAHALSGDLEKAGQLIADSTEEHAIRSASQVWMQSAMGKLEEPAEVLDTIEGEKLPPFFFVLAAETHRLLASLTGSRAERLEYLEIASLLLFEEDSVAGATHSPERRRVACLTALDIRDDERSRSACRQLIVRDAASRPATAAGLRWLSYLDLLDEADFLIARHLDQTHSNLQSTLLAARVDLWRGAFDDARQKLDAIDEDHRELVDYLIVNGDYALRTGQFEEALDFFDRAAEKSSLRRTEVLLGIAEATLFTTGPNDEIEEFLRSALRDGEFGPRAWALFASLRRKQGRMADARENISFARRALDDFGSADERVHLLTERIAIIQTPRNPGHASIASLIEEADSLAPHYWRFHLLAARWHRNQSEVDSDALRSHLRAALTAAPELCRIWTELDELDSSVLQRQVAGGLDRPEEC